MEQYKVIPNVAHPITVDGQELLLCGLFDTLHYYPPLDVHWLRYFDNDTKELMMVILKEVGADVILGQTDVPYIIRETIFQTEYENLVEVLGTWVTDEMFGIDPV